MRRVIGRKSTEEDRPSQTNLPFRAFCRGIVNLARRWPRGKVAKKARIPVASLPVVPWSRGTGTISKRLAFMNCPLCGEVCRCPLEPLSSALQGSADVESAGSSILAASSLPADAVLQAADEPAWRDELSDRLNRYRARRKVRPPRYPSLSLQFDARIGRQRTRRIVRCRTFESVSNHALALDGMRHEPSAAAATRISQVTRRRPSVRDCCCGPRAAPHASRPVYACQREDYRVSGIRLGPARASAGSTGGASWGRRPRILEVPEVAPPPPALGGITIEPAEQGEAEKRPGIDIPLQSAPLGRRCVAALVDGSDRRGGIGSFRVHLLEGGGGASAAGCRFWGSLPGISCLFWAAYQYLMIVYAASTPGLRVAGLELARFDGTSTSRSLRRWRVLASCLSAVSAGMGYAVGVSRRRCAVLARPDHAHLSRAGKTPGKIRKSIGRMRSSGRFFNSCYR